MQEPTLKPEEARGEGPGGLLRTRPVLPACAIVLLALFAYLPALDAGFVFDDSVYVTGDTRLETPGGLARIWTEVAGPVYRHQYYPLTSTTFWLQHRLWGRQPVGYHLVNILLHAVNALLLWRVLRRVGLPGAWLAGALFAVHPVHVQSVAWVSELKNVLSTCFFLLSALAFLRWFRLEEGVERRPRPGPGLYLAAMALFSAALLSKTATCLLPVGLLLVLWWKRGGEARRDLPALAPPAVLGAAFVALTVYLETRHGGAGGSEFAQPLAARLAVAGRALWFYAGKLLWPAELVFIYPRWSVDPGAAAQYVPLLGAVAVGAALWLARDRLGRGPAAAFAFFAVAVVPLSLVNVAYTRHAWVADHWQYWASMGLLALAAGGAGRALRAGPRQRIAVTAAAAVALAACTALAWRRAHVYESPLALWGDTVERNPASWAARNNLGIALAAAGRDGEAVRHYHAALRLRPDYGGAYVNLGNALLAQERLDEAIALFERAIELEPDLAEAHYDLANALRGRGDLRRALAHYRRALALRPDYARAHNNLGAALLAAGRAGEAAGHVERAVALRPGEAGFLYNLALVRLRQNREADAARHLKEALDADPTFEPARATLRRLLEGIPLRRAAAGEDLP